MTKRNTPPSHIPITGVLSENKVVRKESSDNYSQVLVQFLAEWRLIVCKHGKQGIVQNRSTIRPNNGVWIGKKHVTTKSSLLVVCSALHLIRDAATAEKVLALPEHFREMAKK
jgi:hypothetical protein